MLPLILTIGGVLLVSDPPVPPPEPHPPMEQSTSYLDEERGVYYGSHNGKAWEYPMPEHLLKQHRARQKQKAEQRIEQIQRQLDRMADQLDRIQNSVGELHTLIMIRR